MGIISSMATAISGLESNGNALSVISDNIVNSNTTGFKASRAEFQSVLAQDLAIASGLELGRGVMLGGVSTVFTQGSLSRTDRGTDCALNGNGFFIVKNNAKGTAYTRDGSFSFDKEGWLVNLSGNRVQAYQSAPDTGHITGKLGDIRIPYNNMPSKGTENVQLHVNLDARLNTTDTFDVNRPDETSQFVTSFQVFDSIGNAHAVNVCFNKTGSNNWSWNAFTDGGNVTGGTLGKPTQIGQGDLQFDVEGKLVAGGNQMVSVDFANGAIPNQQIKLEFGPPALKEGVYTGEGSTQYGSRSAAFRNTQDGWASGYLADVMIDNEGLITGVYTNGQSKSLGQLAVARFESSEKLGKIGENQFRETSKSGPPSIGKPNTNGRGEVMTKNLENSNVDIAKEFVDLIRVQRGFQASAKSITTADQMLDEIVNIKRS